MSKSYQTAHREALGCLAFCQEDTTQKQLPSSKEGITCGIQLLGTSRINGIAKNKGEIPNLKSNSAKKKMKGEMKPKISANKPLGAN